MNNRTKTISISFLFVVFFSFAFSFESAAKKIYLNKMPDNNIYINGGNFLYAAGDTFVLRASQGPYGYLDMTSFSGTAAQPLVIQNEGGQVNISIIRLRHCKYIKVLGNGSGDQYGFFMTSSATNSPAMSVSGRSSNIEMAYADINSHGYGFWVKEEGACEDSLQYPNYVIDNISLHDNRVRNTYFSGFYLGSTDPNGTRPYTCNGVTSYPKPLRLGNIKVYNNIIDRTGRGGIQLSCAQFGTNEIYGNTITNVGQQLDGQQGNGIVLGGYTHANIYNNTVNYTFAAGIFSLGAGLIKIENNNVQNSGSLNGVSTQYGSNIYIDTRETLPAMNTQFIIKNNVLGAHTGERHIRVHKSYNTFETNNVICNNTSVWNTLAVHVDLGIIWAGCTTNQLPVVNPGPNQNIVLPTNGAYLQGSATDADGTVAAYQWTKISGPASYSIQYPGGPMTMVNNLTEGVYVFRLTCTDNQSSTNYSDVTVNVTTTAAPSIPSGSTKIEAENFSNMAGVQSETCFDAGGGLNIGWQDNNDWMDYSVNVPTAGNYTVKFRVASLFNNAQFQLRNSSGSVLTTVNVPYTTGFQNWTTVSTTVNLPAGQQTLRILTNNAGGGWNINWWEIAGGSGSTSNQNPMANAGSNQVITLPANAANLSGSGTDADGSITSYAWTKVSGPAGETIAAPGLAQTNVTGLVPGTYVFRLTVKDNAGATASADVTITENAAPSSPAANIKIEAEAYSNMSGIQTEPTADAGGGLNIGWQDNNDWMDYAVNVPSTGTYTLNFRVATIFNGPQFQVRTSTGAVVATVTVPNTGGFQNWQTVSVQGNLPAGAQTLRIVTTQANGGWNFNWWEVPAGTTTTPPPTTNPSPGGSVNMKIEAESFSNMSGIQTENTADAGGGMNVGWQDNNDWMDYAVNVSAAGTYTLNFRVATIFNAPQFQLRTSTGAVLATVTVPNTGGFQNWQTVSAQVTLAAGQQTVRIVTSQANGGWNFNWWEITGGSTSVSPTPAPTPTSTKIEAETYSNMAGIQTEPTADAGGGMNVGWQDNNDWMDYAVNIATAGTYSVKFRVATLFNAPQFQLRSSTGNVLATVTVPNTGGFQNWQTVTAQVTLAAGQQTLRVVTTQANGGWNFNWFELAPVGEVTMSVTSTQSEATTTDSKSMEIFPNPVIDKFMLSMNNELTGTLKVQVINIQGSTVKEFSLSKSNTGTSQFYLNIGTLPAGQYIITATMNGWTESKQIIKQ
jgi:hypothetical protein